MANTKRCIIITAKLNGTISENIDILPEDLVLCADGGYAYAKAEGVTPDAIIGDFDSLSDELCEDVLNFENTEHGKAPEIVRLAVDKKDTDTIACVKYGLRAGCGDFVIVGGLSGRLDHTIANLNVLSFLVDMGVRAWIRDSKNHARMIKGTFVEGMPTMEHVFNREVGINNGTPGMVLLSNRKNYNFSVYSYVERSTGVSIKGAKYNLDKAVMTNSYPLGTSNEFDGDNDAIISVEFGRLLIILSEND
ncbi:MAG: thiamine diphosphokinase [Clostridiales Family XIII bacterium]|jgi:thiamine pyrophosphokinase|nr:thiamine diphosphokinase [Clostridiales Family XIII bacterium]